MKKNLLILLTLAAVVALPFLFRQDRPTGAWHDGDPVLVVVSPHIAAIRDEFAEAFSAWHRSRFGKPVRIDWRAIGGTTEIMRYLSAEYATAFRAAWRHAGHEWPDGGADAIFDRKFKPDSVPADVATHAAMRTAWELRNAAWKGFRASDDASDFTCRIDVFFGGGTYDHHVAAGQGLTVPVWPPDHVPPGILTDAAGREQIPLARGGEPWRSTHYYSAALSAFGICYNPDRLRDLGIARVPSQWTDLADPRYVGQIGVTDPTKSGSIAKAFEMIIHTECHRAVATAGFTREDIAAYESAISAARLPNGELPPSVPAAYQTTVEQGWAAGLRLVQMIGANARYFTDGSGKVSVDVASGDAAAGISIDFYSRVQAEVTRTRDGRDRLVYVTPVGGSSVSGDPISLLRGAPNRELGARFIEFVLSTEGQKLWNYRPGTPGGPRRYALRRLPVRREFYASDDPAEQAVAAEHAKYTSDRLTDPEVDAYRLSGAFEYVPRWTAAHFGFFRLMIRCMCMDAGVELRSAWKAILDAGGPEACPVAVSLLCRLPDAPEPVQWRNAAALSSGDTLDVTRQWTIFFRRSYAEAEAAARAGR
jgi:ABC-type Fe3+ transport system substrate-binding protein